MVQAIIQGYNLLVNVLVLDKHLTLLFSRYKCDPQRQTCKKCESDVREGHCQHCLSLSQ